jgi:hypothetical protein
MSAAGLAGLKKYPKSKCFGRSADANERSGRESARANANTPSFPQPLRARSATLAIPERFGRICINFGGPGTVLLRLEGSNLWLPTCCL